MMKIIFDSNAKEKTKISNDIKKALDNIPSLESLLDIPIVVFQDGVNGSYYVKCSLSAEIARSLCDTNAKLDYSRSESFRANRELYTSSKTYLKMVEDAAGGREFNDIIVEYNGDYEPTHPLKIWGGQHRINALTQSESSASRYHGFRIYFDLDKKQRTDLALVSNTNISVSNDTFDRMIEETIFGDKLRRWCQEVGFLGGTEDFPDVGSRSNTISVKKARSFIVNFFRGREKSKSLSPSDLDKNYYTPYLVETGVSIDPEYRRIMDKYDILTDKLLKKAGKRFLSLHNAQSKAVLDKETNVKNSKAYRNKALVESVLCGWSYVSGLLQSHKKRLENHFKIPRVNRSIPDPLSAEEMSKYKHDSDAVTYRGLGTRSSVKDRQRIAQLFLAKSSQENAIFDRKFINMAVSTVVGLITLSKGYTVND